MKAGVTINRPPRDWQHGVHPLARRHLDRTAAEGRAEATGRALGFDAEHRQLVSAMLESRDRLEGMLAAIADPAGEGARAFTKVYAEEARAAADAADARARFGHRLSPIDGLIVSIKDLFDVAGETTRAGTSSMTMRRPPKADAPIVARLRAAGAVIVGRTNMTEFAFSGIGINPHYGTPGNPADRCTRAGRLVVRRGRRGGGRHLRHRHRLRYRRLGAAAGRLLRRHGVQADASPRPARRRDAALAVARFRSARSQRR